jgi:lysophospholipase L1-like esterase
MRVTAWWRSAFTIGVWALVSCSSPSAGSDTTTNIAGTAPVPSAEDPAAQATDPPLSTVAPPSTVRVPFAPGPITVIAIGDSLTLGQGDTTNLGYPGRLKERLTELRPGSDVLNLGKAGWTSAEVIKGRDSDAGELDAAVEATHHALDAKRPVVVTVLVGTYDLWDLYNHGPEAGTREAEETADLDSYRSNITTIVSSLQQAGAVVLIGLPDDLSQRPVASDSSRRKQLFPGITDDELTRLSAQSRRYDAVVGEVATGLGATVVDFASTTIFSDPATMSADGNHPNADGYDAMTEVWWSALQPLLG